MNRFAALAAVAAGFALSGADTLDPLAPARDGNLQCYSPNLAQKTCRAMAGYTFEPDGTILNEATVLLSPDNDLVMKTVSPVEVRGSAVCGQVRKDDIKSAAIYVNGRKLPMDQANMVRVQVQVSMASRFGKEICTTYEPFKYEFYAHVTIDGVNDTESLDYVRWVKPDEGYTVAP